MKFQIALSKETTTHKLGGHLDQVFAKNIEITNAVVNDGFDHSITDHKCIKVTLKHKANQGFNINQYNQQAVTRNHLILKQGTIRELMNLEQTIQEMIDAPYMIKRPAHEYIEHAAKDEAITQEIKKTQQREIAKHQPVKYRTRNQVQEEMEELAIANEFDEIKNIDDLTKLYREGRLKEFYQVANKVLRIKRNHPVVNKVQKENETGEFEVIDDKTLVE